jgi:hypothetical protein
VTGSADRAPGDSTADLVLQIAPEPTAAERDALVAALAILIAEPVAAIAATQTHPTPSRWARAGREAAVAARRVRRRWAGP